MSIKLYNEDFFEVVKTLSDASFDMIFADPPYMLSKTGTSCINGKLVKINKGEWDKGGDILQDFEFHTQWLKECKRLLKPNGTIWVSGTYHSIHSCGLAMMLEKYHILNEIAWFKPNAAPNLSCKYFTASHETLIWARKDKKAKHYFDYNAMKNGHFPKDIIKNEGKQMRTVWSICPPDNKEKAFNKHPAQKPLALLERIITASTKEGDVVFDPFMGSGTTGVICKQMNRSFVGIELDKSHFALAKERIENQLI